MKKYFFYLVLFLSLSCNKDEDNVVPDKFKFNYNLHSSLPQDWIDEFNVIMGNLDKHIPGAIFWNIEEHSDKDTPVPHMLPNSEKFENIPKKRLEFENAYRVLIWVVPNAAWQSVSPRSH